MSFEIAGLIRIEIMQKTAVLVAVEPAPLSRLIEHLLQGWPKARIVEQLNDAPALVKRACRLRPKLIIANMTLLGQQGEKILSQVKQSSPGSKVIVTGFPQGFRRHAQQWGADAYLEEEDLVRHLVPLARKLLSKAPLASRSSAITSRGRASRASSSVSVRPSKD
ncbi:MAG: hypothetical protein HY648_01275 [Acidobacteria bacterium]|nr:hypothetical protein [Acidobacteriota bacterium]